MELQVMTPSPAIDFNFNFNSTSTSPYTTAPSTPQRTASFFYSEPTGLPSSLFVAADGPQSTIPFNWEEKPGIRKQNNQVEEEGTDFAFDFSSKSQRHSISAADELFDSGKIKPLKPPPRLQFSGESPKSPTLKFREALSPRAKKKDFDPLSEAFKQTSRDHTKPDQNQSLRGRERTPTTTKHKVSRSLSPFRAISDEENDQKNSRNQSLTWYNKWGLKNLLLFRSASEGSAATSKESYSMMMKGSRDSGGSVVGSTSWRRRKTQLAYKTGLLGCLRFHNNGGSFHEISQGLGSLTRQPGE